MSDLVSGRLESTPAGVEQPLPAVGTDRPVANRETPRETSAAELHTPRWIKQTILAADPDWFAKGITPGNCQQAALASMLALPLADVPHFAAAPPEDGIPEGWSLFRDVRLWLREHRDIDYAWTADEAIYAQLREAAPEWSEPYGIALGRTRRGPALHSVVWNLATWHLAHDPHPDDSGLTEVLQVEWLTSPYDPEPHEQVRLWLEKEAEDVA